MYQCLYLIDILQGDQILLLLQITITNFMRRTLINLYRFADWKDFKGNQSGSYKNSYNNNYNSNYNPQNVMQSSIDVKNYNLMISLQNWMLSLYIVPPILIKKSSTSFEIKKANLVMGMLFIPKNGEETNWNQRKSINFKLMDVGKLLYVAPGSGKQTTVVATAQGKGIAGSQQLMKEMKIVDDPKKETMSLILKQFSGGSSQNVQPSVELNISHEQYALIYQLIRASLFEMSGWKFQMDIYKKDIMAKAFQKKSSVGGNEIEDLLSRKGF